MIRTTGIKDDYGLTDGSNKVVAILTNLNFTFVDKEGTAATTGAGGTRVAAPLEGQTSTTNSDSTFEPHFLLTTNVKFFASEEVYNNNGPSFKNKEVTGLKFFTFPSSVEQIESVVLSKLKS